MSIKKNIKKLFIMDEEKGYYTVETAIIIPFILVLMLTLGYVIKVISVEEKIVHAMTDECRYSMIQSYLTKTDPLVGMRAGARILEENKQLEKAFVTSFAGALGSGTITVNCKASDFVKFPLGFSKTFKFNNRIAGRAFIGGEARADKISFDEMEKSSSGNIVWIFPYAGEKYHIESCRYVHPEPKQGNAESLTDKGYGPCILCKPDTARSVYYFPNYGASFHNKDCNAVSKNVVAIDKEAAKDRGYSPCSVCNP